MTAIYFLVNFKVDSDSNISLYYVKYFLLAKMFVSCCEMHLFCRHSQSLHTSQLHNIQIQDIFPCCCCCCPVPPMMFLIKGFCLTFFGFGSKKIEFPANFQYVRNLNSYLISLRRILNGQYFFFLLNKETSLVI